MSLASVKDFFKQLGLEDRIVTLHESTATVEDAAREHKVTQGQIGKTLAFRIGEKPLLIVVAGNKKIDNKKYKAKFHAKAKMLNTEEALDFTGHEFGGICPFGLKNKLDVFLDESLKAYDELIPAAGDRNSAIRLTLDEIEKHTEHLGWVDVCG